MRLLLVTPDDSYMNSFLGSLATRFTLDVTHSADSAAFLLHVNSYDVVVIDGSKKAIDSKSLCTAMRSSEFDIPILVLGAFPDISEKVQILDSGADGYISYPLNEEEFFAEILCVLRRRSVPGRKNKLQIGVVGLDLRNRVAYAGGTILELRRKEFDLLEYLMFNKSRIVSKEELLEHLWDGGLETRSNTVEVHVKHLRDKLSKYCGNSFLLTRRGFGYVIYG